MPRGSEKLILVPEPGGVFETANHINLPSGRLASASNFLIRENVFVSRSGYQAIADQLDSFNAVIGFGFLGDPRVDTNMVVQTLTKTYDWDGSVFTDITGFWTTSNLGEHARFLSFDQGGTTYLLRINPQNAIDEWNGSGLFTDTAGLPPTGSDILYASGRIVVIRANGDDTRVQWSEFNDRTVWPSTNIAILQATPGRMIAGRSFGALSFAVYKEDSVNLMTAQAAAAPFQVQEPIQISGPVSTAAVVNFNGNHYWLGLDGNIYVFDGGRVLPFNTDLAQTVRETFNLANRDQAHGMVLDITEAELWFFYPDNATSSIVRAISVQITTGQAHTHLFPHSITASSQWAVQPTLTIDDLTGTIDGLDSVYPTIDSMGGGGTKVSLIGEDLGFVSRFNITSTDRGTQIPWFIDHGWRAVSDVREETYIDRIQTYWSKQSESLPITVSLAVSDTVNGEEVYQTGTVNPMNDEELYVHFPNTRGKWARLKFSAASSTTTLKNYASAIFGWTRRMW